ncbi:hypothetical protein [Kitasatospora sp. MMS16-BH015]|uniref:hypothetical protein n=1 Tax=Kitasatospora sp. MMS16-BH015 TaxID=2018025 RepID=UPI000CF2B44A|nr:hypothetical protein [Kitasatospora sp. MMS16-BH015]
MLDSTFEESILQQVPIYAGLAATWRAAGRAVPGSRDPEWARLAAPPPYFSPRPSPVTGVQRYAMTPQGYVVLAQGYGRLTAGLAPGGEDR